MPTERLGQGSKDPNRVAGAPFPPAREHHDGQDRRARQVPSAPPSDDDEQPSEATKTEPEEDTDGP